MQFMDEASSTREQGGDTHPHRDIGFHFPFPFLLRKSIFPLTSYSRNIKGVCITGYGLSFCSSFSGTSRKGLQRTTAGLGPGYQRPSQPPPRALPPRPASSSMISQLLELLCPVPATASITYHWPPGSALTARLCRPTHCCSLTHPGHCFGFPGFHISWSTSLPPPLPPHPPQLLRLLNPCAFQARELPRLC